MCSGYIYVDCVPLSNELFVTLPQDEVSQMAIVLPPLFYPPIPDYVHTLLYHINLFAVADQGVVGQNPPDHSQKILQKGYFVKFQTWKPPCMEPL